MKNLINVPEMSVEVARHHLKLGMIKRMYEIDEDTAVDAINVLLVDHFERGQRSILKDIKKLMDENEYPEYLETALYDYMEKYEKGECN